MTHRLLSPSHTGAPSLRRHRPLRPAGGVALGVALLLGACASYEPPKPGQHRGPGQPRAEISCEYGPPTAMVIRSWRCRPTETQARDEDLAREALESIRIPPPPPP